MWKTILDWMKVSELDFFFKMLCANSKQLRATVYFIDLFR